MVGTFTIALPRRIVYGSGRISDLPELAASFGKNVLLVTGASSLEASGVFGRLRDMFADRGIEVRHIMSSGEPTVDFIDDTLAHVRNVVPDVVIAVGGGSVIDTGKAIAAMFTVNGSVFDYLEGVGIKTHPGTKIPLVACPTTAGSGSEATKNAVVKGVHPLSLKPFKKSLRHDNFIPDVAIVDPELMLSCPPDVSAACGMDALTQLIEAYVSTESTLMTDAITLSGIAKVRGSLISVCGDGAGDVSARMAMAYAATISGIALANAGLGVVHGIAGVMGGMFDIPHGVICGTLLAPATRVTIEKLRGAGKSSVPALEKYARIGVTLSGMHDVSFDRDIDALITILYEYTEILDMPRFGEYDLKEEDIDSVAKESGNGNNPAQLSRDDIFGILRERL